MMKLMSWFKQKGQDAKKSTKDAINHLTHKHNDVKIGFRQEEDAYERYSIRQYKCTICGRTKWVDGRYDHR